MADTELLPDDGCRDELWEGDLVRMCPTQRVCGEAAGKVVGRLLVYLEQNPIGSVYVIGVRSPGNTEEGTATKAAHSLAHGGCAVWALRARDRTLRNHRPGAAVQTLSGDDLLTEEFLPGFAVRVADLFPR